MTATFRLCARLAALGLTVSTAVMVALTSVDTFAYQCLAQLQCRNPLWFTWVLDFFAPLDRPGYRIAFGVYIPVAVAAVFYIVASRSRSRYESVEPPVPGDGIPSPHEKCAAAQKGGLRSSTFWSGRRWHQHLADLHLAAGVAVVAWMLAWCVSELSAAMLLPVTPALITARVAVLASTLLIGAVLLMLCWDDAQELLARLVLISAAGVLVLAVLSACALPIQLMPDGGVAQAAGVLPGMVVAVNCGWGFVLVLFFLLVLQQLVAWAARWRAAWMAESPRPADLHRGLPQLKAWWRRLARARRTAQGGIKVFPWGAPVVFNALAFILGNTVLLSYMVFAAQVMGKVQYAAAPEIQRPVGGSTDAAVLWVPLAVRSVASYLNVGLLAVFGLFAIAVALWLFWTTRKKGKKTSEVRRYLKREYEKENAQAHNAQPGSAAGLTLSDPGLLKRREVWQSDAFDPAVAPRNEDPRDPDTPAKWVQHVARMQQIAAHGRMLVAWLSIVITAAGVIVLPFFQAQAWLIGLNPMPWDDLGTSIGILLPGLYVAVAQLVFRNEKWRRVLMTPFDVGTFFPRSFHPFAPPSYTERAIPELSRRIWYLHDNNGRVMLTAHSQGSVVALAVLARRSRRKQDAGKSVGLVTLGSPLGKLYRWGFPSLVTDELLQSFADGKANLGGVCWRNVYYATDYIGGAIRAEHWSAEGLDRELVDPTTSLYVYGQPMPRVLSHTGYWVDTRFWDAVDEICHEIMPHPHAHRERVYEEIPPDPTVPIQYRGA